MLAPQGQSPPSPDSDLESIRRRAERAYDRTLATLWIGNGVAALATVAYITANRHDGTFTRSLLIPLVLFVVGLSITGISCLAEFESERRRIADLGNEDSAAHRPDREVRSHADRRTVTALVSGSCFVIGFIFCFVMLARN